MALLHRRSLVLDQLVPADKRFACVSGRRSCPLCFRDLWRRSQRRQNSASRGKIRTKTEEGAAERERVEGTGVGFIEALINFKAFATI